MHFLLCLRSRCSGRGRRKVAKIQNNALTMVPGVSMVVSLGGAPIRWTLSLKATPVQPNRICSAQTHPMDGYCSFKLRIIGLSSGPRAFPSGNRRKQPLPMWLWWQFVVKNIAFGTLWRQFGVHHGAILAGWARLESRKIFTPGRISCAPSRPRPVQPEPVAPRPVQPEPGRRSPGQDWPGYRFSLIFFNFL